MMKTMGTMVAISPTRSLLTEEMPSSNEVLRGVLASEPAISPIMVLTPVATTTPRPWPEMTVDPASTRSSRPMTGHFSPASERKGSFSMESDSPVSDAWLTKRSRAEKMRMSAWATHPEERRMTSPTTICSTAVSLPPSPSRSTFAHGSIILASDAAATVLRSDCVNLRRPDARIMNEMMAGVVMLLSPGWANTQSVSTDTPAMNTRM
nr:MULTISPECIES: hypothetical protein [Atopobiaceae]